MATYDEEVMQRAAALRQRAAGANMGPTAPPVAPVAARGASPALAAATPKPARMPMASVLSNPAIPKAPIVGALAGQSLVEGQKLGAVFSDKAASGMDKGAAVGESAARVGGAGIGAAYGAAKGAALGTSILPGWGTAAGALIGGIGGSVLGPKIADTAIGAGRAVTDWAMNPSQDSQPAQASYSNEGRNSKPPMADPNAPAAAAIVAATPTSVNASQESPQTPTAQQGIQRINTPGASPLFTNLPADSQSNVALMARGAPSAQNMAAMSAIQARQDASDQARIRQLQQQNSGFQAPPAGQTLPLIYGGGALIMKSDGGHGLLSDKARKQRELDMQMQRGMSESKRDYAARMSALSAIYGSQSGLEGAQLNAEVARERNTQEAGLGASRMRLDEQRAATDAMQAQDNMATNNVKRGAAQLEMGAAQQIADLRRQYLEAPTEEARAAIGKKLTALSGKGDKQDGQWKSVVVPGGKDQLGNDMPGNAMLYNEATGEYRPMQDQKPSAQAPAAAIDFLKKNPGQAQAFKSKYGYLPEGFQ